MISFLEILSFPHKTEVAHRACAQMAEHASFAFNTEITRNLGLYKIVTFSNIKKCVILCVSSEERRKKTCTLPLFVFLFS